MSVRRETVRTDVIRLDPTPKRDFSIADPDDDDSVVLEIEDNIDNEDEFDGELGYFLVKMLRGTTLGRQIKREVFKLSIYHLLWGFILFIISVYQDIAFGPLDGLFYDEKHGGSIIQMQFTTALGALIMTGLSWAAMNYWSSLVTNRSLLGSLLILYQCLIALHFTIVLWSINALGATFKNTDWRNEEAIIRCVPRTQNANSHSSNVRRILTYLTWTSHPWLRASSGAYILATVRPSSSQPSTCPSFSITA